MSRAETVTTDYGAVICFCRSKKQVHSTPDGSKTWDKKSGGDPQNHRPELLTLISTQEHR